MHRLLVALLAALDAVIAAAGGVAIVLAPLTLLWVVGLGSGADWAALWPASGAVWQLGHLVPLAVTLPAEYLTLTGIDPAAASFTLSLAPLALAVFTGAFAARSGRRAAQAGAPATGAVTGTLVFTALATVVALTTVNTLATAELWRAILYPALVFGLPALTAAFIEGWRLEERGAIARLRTWTQRGAWGALPALIVRGTAVAATGLLGVGAAVSGVAVLLSGGEVVALFEAAHVDAVGVVVLALAQLAYLPTLIMWGLAFVAGPGFAVGAGSAVSPAGTQVGVLPGIPVLGAVPESSTPWLLLLALLPVGVGVLTGWMLRSRLAARPSALADHDGGFGVRLVLAVAVSVVTAGLAALFAALASGSIGPGRLAELGPQPGVVALAIGTEILVGAAILLLLPRRAEAARSAVATTSAPVERSDSTASGLDAWERLAAAHPFSSAERPFPATDPWQAPGASSGDAETGAVSSQDDDAGMPEAGAPAEPGAGPGAERDADATEPIPGFERGGGASGGAEGGDETPDGRPPHPSVD
ncbi:DUF6350 family protein [Microbacterium sp. P07]|uniref:cell division protein PerM n=1 Tax=Microbacterium sp. P07 TaxID=3366952 RepID=UPI0037477623